MGIDLSQGPAIALLSIRPQGDHPSFHRRHLFNHVHCWSIRNSQKLETIKMVINKKWIKNVVYVYNRILLNNFKSNITKSAGKWMKLEKNNPNWGIPDSERWIRFVFAYIWILALKSRTTKLQSSWITDNKTKWYIFH